MMRIKKAILMIILYIPICLNANNSKKVNCYEGSQNGPYGGFNRNDSIPPNPGDSLNIPVLRSSDPNEIIGPKGYDSLRWVKLSDQLSYTIYFENDPNFATAAAQKVQVRYAFGKEADMNSFGLGSFGFGNFDFEVEGAPSIYQKRLDLRDSLGIYVDVTAGLDVVKKEAFWIFQSIDPETGLAPIGASMGFLPVNNKVKHNGEGFVNFAMRPKSTCETNDSIVTQASIVFDTNEAISTNIWKNTIDAVAPTSKVTGKVDADDVSKFQLRFVSGDDKNGCGVKQLTLYLSQNKGVYKEYSVCKPDSVLLFTTDTGTEYAFYTIAQDQAGNVEAPKTAPDLVINSNMPPTNLILSDSIFNDDIALGGFIGELSSIDTENNQKFTYALTEGNGAIHNELFAVSENRLVSGVSFKCAEDTIYQIRLSTIDAGNLSYEKCFSLKLKHVLEKPEPDTLSATICEGQKYTFHGTAYDKTGLFSYHKENEYCCDSVYVLNLQVNPYPECPTIAIEGTSTLVSSSLVGNQWFDESGAIEGAVFQLLTPNKTGTYYVVVSNGGCASIPSASYFVNLSDSITLSWNLYPSWNWISSNISDQKLQNPNYFLNSIQSNVEKMLGQTNELVNDPIYGLTGGLTSLNAGFSYKLNMKSNDELVLSGKIYQPEEFLLNLKKGWNWVGYIPSLGLSTNIALSKLKAEENDVIKGIDDFSMFDGSKWTGTLDIMRPGEGYLYYSSSFKTFKFSSVKASPVSLISNEKQMRSSVARSWSVDKHKYSNNMSIVARLYDNDATAESGIYTVGAFSGGECCGVGQYVDGLLFITVHGEKAGKIITFNALENATQNELDIKESIAFGETTLGSLTQPFKLNLNKIYTGTSFNDINLTIYPNPIRDRIYLSGDFPEIKELKILTTSGAVIASYDSYIKKTGLDVSTLIDGIYIVAVYLQDGILYRKIIKSGKSTY